MEDADSDSRTVNSSRLTAVRSFEVALVDGCCVLRNGPVPDARGMLDYRSAPDVRAALGIDTLKETVEDIQERQSRWHHVLDMVEDWDWQTLG